MSPHTDNIEEMWNVFKCELQESINTFIPTIRNFNSIKRVMDQTFKSTSKNQGLKKHGFGRDIWKQEILTYSVNTNLLGMLSVEKLEK